MADIIGTNGNDTLSGNYDDTLTGAGGNDIYYINTDVISITDFGGVGQGTNPTAEVIAEVDTLIFQGYGLTAQNLLLTQNGNDLEITFNNWSNRSFNSQPTVTLQNFALENLDNLSTSTGATVNLGNILFDGQTTTTDSFDVFNANSTQSTIFNKNTVTFLNDLNNNVDGFDDSDDVINGQGGDDIIDGKSGNDLLRGGAGNNTLIGGAGNDLLDVKFSTGDNILNGGLGNDNLDAAGSSGNNFLSGGNGNDYLYASYIVYNNSPYDATIASGDNTLDGGAGNDTLNAESQEGNNLLFGADGNDLLSTSGYKEYRSYIDFTSSGDNTLNGGTGNDTLLAQYSTGNNSLSGGDGSDSLSISGIAIGTSGGVFYFPSSGNNTLDGGTGDDTLSAAISTGNNLLFGGVGDDSLSISGFYPSSGSNTLNGGIGDDVLSTNGSSGNNILNGDAGDDTLDAGGSTGNNTLQGGDGKDILIGGNSNDILYGGNGTDTFAFNSYNDGINTIDDFKASDDFIQVSATGFGGGLTAGLGGVFSAPPISAAQFTIGTSATTSDQRFIYDNSTGSLFFDQDGSADGFTQVNFAQLSSGLSLTNNNIVVV